MEIILPTAGLFILGVSGVRKRTGVRMADNTKAENNHYIFSLVTVIGCLVAIVIDHSLAATLTPTMGILIGHYVGKQSK